jgi:hypothetical protein
MKRLLSLFSLFFLLLIPSVFAQSAIAKYVLATKGDTLVVKDETDYGAPDALHLLMAADTLAVPAGRVYQLHANGYYSVISSPTSSSKVKAIIAGYSNALIKGNKSTDEIPIVTGAVYEGSTSKGGITSGLDLIVKNVNCNSGNSSATTGDWTFFGINGTGKLTLDNCLIEHNIWCEIQPQQMQKLYFLNSYFVNLSGYTCRRNGGVEDFNSTATVLDTLWVENCTHVMTQGSLYKFRDGYKVNKSVFNHNDFINCAGFVFMNRGTVSNISVTNNIFVNCDVQPYSPILNHADQGEVDSYSTAMGIINVAPDSALFKAAGTGGAHWYVDKNLVYWDPTLTAAVPSSHNAAKIDGVTNWVSQMITMNARTTAAFSNKTAYPYLTQGTWITGQLPKFKTTATLFGSTLAGLLAWVKICVDTTVTTPLPYWREVYPSIGNFSYSDWPIPVNFSYTDANLLTAGLNGFPVGDLNWFPTQYASWKAQSAAEYTKIQNVVTTGVLVGVKQLDALPANYSLSQNYPNPFNPTTNIKYSLSKESQVSLKVFDMIGREVETLVNQNQKAGSFEVNFNASKLASGVYIYRLQAGDYTQSMKMMLIK